MRNYVVNKPEILAPAGNMESLKSAVNNGANAVYLGLKNFSARSKAGNFTLEELFEAIKFAHFYDVKVYLAVNTVFKAEEKENLISSVFEAYKLGIDAIIIQDLSILPSIRSIMPDIIVHFSIVCKSFAVLADGKHVRLACHYVYFAADPSDVYLLYLRSIIGKAATLGIAPKVPVRRVEPNLYISNVA